MAKTRPSQRPTQTPAPRASNQAARVVQQTVQAQFHQGPLPPPELLRQYDTISPGAADRIIAMAEGEAVHRRESENKQLDSDIDVRRMMAETESRRIDGIFESDKIGQILGAVVSGVALLAAAGTAIAGLAYGVTSRWYWAIPVALVSLPVLGMVKALRSRRTPVRVDTQTTGNSTGR